MDLVRLQRRGISLSYDEQRISIPQNNPRLLRLQLHMQQQSKIALHGMHKGIESMQTIQIQLNDNIN